MTLIPELSSTLQELGFDRLTPVQTATLPHLIAGRDVIARSETGSGKTLAFALGLLNSLRLDQRTPHGLILCPTRELAAQVAREIRRAGRRLAGLTVVELVGGSPFRPQAEALSRGVHVVVGTPGRVRDHLERGTLDLGQLKTVVLDEADRMLDMGFIEDVGLIHQRAGPGRQTVLFSATMPEPIARLSRRVQRQPVAVHVASENTTNRVRHLVIPVEGDQKSRVLHRALRSHPGSALVFCARKATIAELVGELKQNGFEAAGLHGDLEQRDRDQVLAMFRNRSVRCLVATDVAGRGLDVDHLDLIINFDLPHDAETFVHRVGRTGRAGRAGTSISLGNDEERRRLREFARTAHLDLELAEASSLRATAAPKAPAVRTLFINGGRRDKLRPGDVLGALTGQGRGLAASAVGSIEIRDRETFVAIDADQAARATELLRTGKIKGRRFKVGTLTGPRASTSV